MALYKFYYYYAPPLIGGGIKRSFCLMSVCLFVAYIGLIREQWGLGRPKMMDAFLRVRSATMPVAFSISGRISMLTKRHQLH